MDKMIIWLGSEFGLLTLVVIVLIFIAVLMAVRNVLFIKKRNQ